MKTIDFWTAEGLHFIEWTCEECGNENCSIPSPSRIIYRNPTRCESLLAPETVTCYSCEEQFQLNIPDAPEEDDELWKS